MMLKPAKSPVGIGQAEATLAASGPSKLWNAAMLGMFGLVPFGSSTIGILILLFERPVTWFRRGAHYKAPDRPSPGVWAIGCLLALFATAVIGALISANPWS